VLQTWVIHHIDIACKRGQLKTARVDSCSVWRLAPLV
jgi:hypothetical protein